RGRGGRRGRGDQRRLAGDPPALCPEPRPALPAAERPGPASGPSLRQQGRSPAPPDGLRHRAGRAGGVSGHALRCTRSAILRVAQVGGAERPGRLRRGRYTRDLWMHSVGHQAAVNLVDNAVQPPGKATVMTLSPFSIVLSLARGNFLEIIVLSLYS